ncbi:hypothetical protein DPMN_165289 [Dreissena polymorpha]|uniref:Uncharacterized protein n=1 Tax=Dreissena polymorpha TaxID=45954 RepID=A0A9D4EWV4_DREPO|nr:hypothetical protein DPMN_165289 [Dreissena polymorpha]
MKLARFTRTQNAGCMPLKTSFFEKHGAQDQRVRPKQDNSTLWLTRAPSGDRLTTKAAFLLTSYQARFSDERLCSRTRLTEVAVEAATQNPDGPF